MSADGETCDQCGRSPTDYFVDSPRGLAVWNADHADEPPRERLYFCSPACAFVNGYAAGMRKPL